MSFKSIIPGVFLAAAAIWAQPPARVEFEVASIKAVEPTADQSVKAGVQVDGSQIHMNKMSLQDCVRVAYQVKLYQISGQDWMKGERFDIAAKLPDGANREQVPDMLRSLLEDRFQIKVHREQKEFPVYGLVVMPGGSKMKEVPPDPETDGVSATRRPFNIVAEGGPRGVNVTYGPGSYFKFADGKIEGRKLAMANFVDVLGRFVDRPVIDMTQLPARYDLDVALTENDYNAMLIRAAVAAGVNLPPQVLRMVDNADGSLGFALKPLGLKLDSKKAPIEVVVVDSIAKTPTAN